MLLLSVSPADGLSSLSLSSFSLERNKHLELENLRLKK